LKQSLDQLGARASAESVDLMKFLEMWEASKPADARHSNIRPVAHRDFAQEFFFRVAQSLEERVNRYKRNIAVGLSQCLGSLC
jgi:nucleoporin p58/p45